MSRSPEYSPSLLQGECSLCVTSHLRGLYDRTASPTLTSAGCQLPQGGFKPPSVRASTFVDISLVPFNAINAPRAVEKRREAEAGKARSHLYRASKELTYGA